MGQLKIRFSEQIDTPASLPSSPSSPSSSSSSLIMRTCFRLWTSFVTTAHQPGYSLPLVWNSVFAKKDFILTSIFRSSDGSTSRSKPCNAERNGRQVWMHVLNQQRNWCKWSWVKILVVWKQFISNQSELRETQKLFKSYKPSPSRATSPLRQATSQDSTCQVKVPRSRSCCEGWLGCQGECCPQDTVARCNSP